MYAMLLLLDIYYIFFSLLVLKTTCGMLKSYLVLIHLQLPSSHFNVWSATLSSVTTRASNATSKWTTQQSMSSAFLETRCLHATCAIDISPALQSSWHISGLTPRSSLLSALFVEKPLVDRRSLPAIRRYTITSMVIPAQTAASSLKLLLCLSTTNVYTLENGHTCAYIKSVARGSPCPKLSRSTSKYMNRRGQKVSKTWRIAQAKQRKRGIRVSIIVSLKGIDSTVIQHPTLFSLLQDLRWTKNIV